MYRTSTSNGNKQTLQYLPNIKQNTINDNDNYVTNNKNIENKNSFKIPKSKQLLPGNNDIIYSNTKNKSYLGKTLTVPDIKSYSLPPFCNKSRDFTKINDTSNIIIDIKQIKLLGKTTPL